MSKLKLININKEEFDNCKFNITAAWDLPSCSPCPCKNSSEHNADFSFKSAHI